MIEPSSPERTIDRLVGVYDADGTLRGELAYWVGRRSGRAHCALCDITHGAVRVRPDWQRCRDTLPVPFETHHRDDQPEPIRKATTGRLPAVVAVTMDGPVLLLGPDELEACGGSPERLVEGLETAAEERALRWT